MTLRTNAIPDDFAHFHAWYGKVPQFEHLREQADFPCTDYWFKLRQLVDCRYYMHWQYSDSKSYTSAAYFKALEDISTCRRIARLPLEQRPAEAKNWFLQRHTRNSVFDYKQPPAPIGRYAVAGA
ncbi:unnamed protein product [Amoebophrya sp. A120]|nr:unnamed protein product [Amoebophrya sp. A120]|eukprot:GSA120T00018460001.1